MSNKIIVVGIGPGSPDYLLPKAKIVINQAKVLLGGRRALAEFSQADKMQNVWLLRAIWQVLWILSHEN